VASGLPTPPSSDNVREEDVQMREMTPKEQALTRLELTALGLNPFDKGLSGLKFGEPDIPMGKLHETKLHMQHRYEEGILQFTKLLMRDGKLSKAQRVSGLPYPGPGARGSYGDGNKQTK
jgi:small subunit ribosomal protein S7